MPWADFARGHRITPGELLANFQPPRPSSPPPA
jgi:hypothetical protein